jgi:hypothetical protein
VRRQAGDERNADLQLGDGVLAVRRAIVEIDLPFLQLNVEERELRDRVVVLRAREELVEQILEVVSLVGVANHPQLRLRQRDLLEHRRDPEDRRPRDVDVELVEARERSVTLSLAHQKPAQRRRRRKRVYAHLLDRDLAVQGVRECLF